ncbi:MAG TPA: hypothetical protein VHD39_04130 [Acidimicrobiales bacterium]|nr:hypothetical protein [Acidimicrobiales bacterium]
MSFFTYALGAIILILVLLRQVRVRPVPRVYQPRLPVILGVIGLFEMFSYAGNHHVSASAWGWVIGSLVIGAIGLGALRGWSMRVWAGDGWVLRQGNALTMGLWLVSLLVHFAGDAAGNHGGAAGLQASSFLLYLGVTLSVQYYVIFRRALPLWQQIGPGEGPPLQVHFTQSPGGFFATFGGPAPGQGGWSAPGRGQAQRQADRSAHDPTIIDAEVVEDDDGRDPPELHAPR